MDATTDQQEDLNKELAERFKQLPKVIQDSITSADVQKRLRALADTNNLHLDQWQILENEVMLTLLGFQEPAALAENLKKDLEIPDELAKTLAENISTIVFEPIRGELERELDNPSAETANVSDVEAAGAQAISQERAEAVLPATPPPEKNEEKATRAPVSEAYRAGEASTVRKNVDDDPYREPVA